VQKKVISIIGSNSFLAQNLASVLQEDEVTIIGYARKNRNLHIDSYHYFDYPENNINVGQLIKSDVIIYTAGNGIQANKETADIDIFRLNTFYPIELMSALSNLGYDGQFFSFGSYAEIGISEERSPQRESEIINSESLVHNKYSISKRLLTGYINNIQIGSYKYYHLMLPTIYGKGENPKRLIPYLIECFKNDTSAKLTNGDQIRQYLHVVDASKYIKAIINHPSAASGIYNMGSEEILSVKEIIAKVQKLCKNSLKVEYGMAKRTDTMMSYIANDDRKLTSLIKLDNIISIDQGVREYLI